MQSPPRDRREALLLLFKNLFWVTFSRPSSVLGTRAITEKAVGTALKELLV